jgi:hypothetical protein
MASGYGEIAEVRAFIALFLLTKRLYYKYISIKHKGILLYAKIVNFTYEICIVTSCEMLQFHI